MPKITFLGAGSTVFAKNVLGDCMMSPALREAHFALHDIDAERLSDSETMLKTICRNVGSSASVTAHADRLEALRGADYVINAVQVGGYEPCTVIDFEIPKKFGLRQTIGDTLGVAGIFRALRTIPVMLDFVRDMEAVCSGALFMNYTNPMGMVTGAVQMASGIKTVGLCHSVQVCAPHLLAALGMPADRLQWKIAGINHQAWLLEITRDGADLYPEIKRRAAECSGPHNDMVRYEIMRRFGYYVTESSEHNAEYMPYFINSRHPELIEAFHIPLDEYPRRCVEQIERWKTLRDGLVNDKSLAHERTNEYASWMIEAMETNIPCKIAGNVLNTGLITNLPQDACVEVPCLVDAGGVTPCHVGALPEQCAALNRTNLNVQRLAIEAALTLKKEYVYHAAMLDPHTAAELTLDQIVALCDALFEAHEGWLPKYQ